jgi:ABC-type uncharacterized transport system permease subunit
VSKKKDKQAAAAPERASNGITIGAHPRARRSVQRMRALGGLVGFLLTLLMSLHAGVPAFDATARALIAGIALHLVAWAVAVAVWRQLIYAELRAIHDRRHERARRRAELVRGDAA